MHFLFPHSTAVPVGLHNSLFLPRNSMQVCLAWLTPSASLSPVEEQPQLKATSFSVLGSLGTLERKVSQDYKSCIEVGWTFLRNSQSVGLGRHERRGGKSNDLLQRNDNLPSPYPSHINYPEVLGERLSKSAFNSKQFRTETDFIQNHYFMETNRLPTANFCLSQYCCNTYHSELYILQS